MEFQLCPIDMTNPCQQSVNLPTEIMIIIGGIASLSIAGFMLYEFRKWRNMKKPESSKPNFE